MKRLLPVIVGIVTAVCVGGQFVFGASVPERVAAYGGGCSSGRTDLMAVSDLMASRDLMAPHATMASPASPPMSALVSISGHVWDFVTGEPLAGAAIYFKDSQIGTITDEDGNYLLETADTTKNCLVCYMLGYYVQERENPGSRENFALSVHSDRLRGSRVRPDNSKVRRLLAAIEANRSRNSPEARVSYQCDVYSKIELDLANAREILQGRKSMQQFDFIFDAPQDTLSGRSKVPAMLSESVVHRRHTSNPDADTEEILANRVSGVEPDANLLTQFTGTLHLRGDFYSPFINAFGIELPSPIQRGGLMYYNYYIVDSLLVDGRKTYVVHYHPKRGISSPAFDGEMRIDAGDWALRSIRARMKHGANVKWLGDLRIDADYCRQPDGGWFYLRNRLTAELSLAASDSTTLAVIGTRILDYSNPSFEPQPPLHGFVTVHPEANSRTEDYWDRARPVPLNVKEEEIFNTVERIKEQPLFRTLYKLAETAINGYFDVGPVGFGNVLQVVSSNPLEGFRVKFGMHTSTELSKKRRVTGYAAYGFGDKELKGGVSYERMFSKAPTRKLTLDAHYDVNQLGKVGGPLIGENVLMVFGNADMRLCPMSNFSALYEWEVSEGVNLSGSLALKRWFGNEFVPLSVESSSIAVNELGLKARFSWDETVTRGHFIKTYVHSPYPVVTLDLKGSVSGLRKNDYGYFRPELKVDWTVNLPPVGTSKLSLTGGTVLGQVPYPLLYMFPANGSYIYNKKAFSCMDYMEFTADRWMNFMWEHNFRGFFLGKIPLVNRLNLREVVGFKMGYGSVRDGNRTSAVFPWPPYLSTMGETPYMEASVGLTNILKFFRVDCCWRLTHREGATFPFKVLFGVDVSF